MRPNDESVSLPGAYALQLAELSSRWNVTADELFAGTGHTLETLAEPTARLTVAETAVLIARAKERTGQAHLAAFLGKQMRLSWHGFLGFAALSASTVRDAIALGERFASTRTQAIGLRLNESAASASLTIEARIQDEEVRQFVLLLLVVGLAEIAQTITGSPVAGAADLDFPEPPDFTIVRPAGTVRFGQPSTRLTFPSSFLDAPLAMADPVATRLAREQCERELSALGSVGGTEARVREAVAALGAAASAESVAKRLHVSTRTLKRQLATVGTTFSEVLDDSRRNHAMLLLEARDRTLESIADELGYYDVANFTRAFKRWTGRTPATYRRA